MKEVIENKKVVIILGVLLLLILLAIVFTRFFSNDNSKIDSNNNNTNNEYKYSFYTMSYNEEMLTDDQKVIARYFDQDYFHLDTYNEITRYATVLKGLKVSTYCKVKTFLMTDDDNYKVTCLWGNDPMEMYTDFFTSNQEIVINGKKPEPMFVEGDVLTIIGKLNGAETVNVNGENKYLPIIEVNEIGIGGANWFSEETIRTVSKLVFGNDIKVRRPTSEESKDMVNNYYYYYSDSLFLIELENQSNLNFKVFDIWQSSQHGLISYNALYNQGIESNYLNKKIFISPDLQKYIVFDMSMIDRCVYISVYDRQFNKMWSKEITKVSNIAWDATNSALAFVSDNDMYLIDLESGENLLSPVFVGKKNKIRIVENGYILLAESSDDAVMFVDKNGKTINKFDINIDLSKDGTLVTRIQEIDDKYVIMYSYIVSDYTIDISTKYIIIDKNGNFIKETE